MPKPIKAFVITGKTTYMPRRFYGNGEWIFLTREEAEKRLAVAQCIANKGCYWMLETYVDETGHTRFSTRGDTEVIAAPLASELMERMPMNCTVERCRPNGLGEYKASWFYIPKEHDKMHEFLRENGNSGGGLADPVQAGGLLPRGRARADNLRSSHVREIFTEISGMTQEKPWWNDESFAGFWAGCFECCEYEKLLEKIGSIVAEAERRTWEDAKRMVVRLSEGDTKQTALNAQYLIGEIDYELASFVDAEIETCQGCGSKIIDNEYAKLIACECPDGLIKRRSSSQPCGGKSGTTANDAIKLSLASLIAEAERRGREKTLEEIRGAAMPIGEMRLKMGDEKIEGAVWEYSGGYLLPKSFFER